jgi:hypothetical protein
MREHLCPILGAICRQRLDPRRRPTVLVGALGARNLRVRNVPEQQVQERVLRLPGHGRAPLPAYELLALQTVELLFDQERLTPGQGGQSTAPEDLPEHRCVLDQLLVDGLQRVEARRNHALHRLW